MTTWNPWRGCKKYSAGCLHCYIHKGDAKRNINTGDIVKTKDFDKPIQKTANGLYKMKSGLVYLCFSSDFLESFVKGIAENHEIVAVAVLRDKQRS